MAHTSGPVSVLVVPAPAPTPQIDVEELLHDLDVLDNRIDTLLDHYKQPNLRVSLVQMAGRITLMRDRIKNP